MNLLRRLVSGLVGGPSPSGRRRSRRAAPMLDGLEGRVVLSRMGLSGRVMASRLATAQVARASTAGSLVTGTSTGACSGGGGSVQDAQLAADRQELQTDLNAALAGSTVTDAQRLALRADLRALADAGVSVDKAALATVADTLLTSIAAGTYDADPASIEASFTAAFAGTSGAALTADQTALVATAYDDFVAVARGLNLDSTELSTLAADRAAIQADLVRLGVTTTDGHAQSPNLDLIVSPGLGLGRGRRGRR